VEVACISGQLTSPFSEPAVTSSHSYSSHPHSRIGQSQISAFPLVIAGCRNPETFGRSMGLAGAEDIYDLFSRARSCIAVFGGFANRGTATHHACVHCQPNTGRQRANWTGRPTLPARAMLAAGRSSAIGYGKAAAASGEHAVGGGVGMPGFISVTATETAENPADSPGVPSANGRVGQFAANAGCRILPVAAALSGQGGRRPSQWTSHRR
jgi:hypothetical protein